MPITTYTSYDEVRISLGLSPKELSDTSLGLEMFFNSLNNLLLGVALPAAYDSDVVTVFAALPSTNRTEAQVRFYNTVRLLATYKVAYDVAVALPGIMLRTVSDGKRSMSRFSPESAYKDIVAALGAKVNSMVSELEGANRAMDVDLLKIITPSIDRVTGE